MADLTLPDCRSPAQRGIAAIEDQARRDRLGAIKGTIYFVMGDHPDAVKIGFTTDLDARLRHLQTGMADDLMLAAAFSGSKYDEWRLHRRFESARMRGEWFRMTKPVIRAIDQYRARPSVAAAIISLQPWQSVDVFARRVAAA